MLWFHLSVFSSPNPFPPSQMHIIQQAHNVSLNSNLFTKVVWFYSAIYCNMKCINATDTALFNPRVSMSCWQVNRTCNLDCNEKCYMSGNASKSLHVGCTCKGVCVCVTEQWCCCIIFSKAREYMFSFQDAGQIQDWRVWTEKGQKQASQRAEGSGWAGEMIMQHDTSEMNPWLPWRRSRMGQSLRSLK